MSAMRDRLALLGPQAAAHGAGAAAGLAALRLGLPLPWLLGGLGGAAALAMSLPRGLPGPWGGPWRPANRLRDLFVVVIGVMIGGTFTPGLMSSALAWAPSLAGLALFCLLSQSAVYLLLRRLGTDRATAWFGASPGGLFESIMLGEAAGGDARRLTLLQFGRIVCVVTLAPLAFSLWAGRAVGSAAGPPPGAGGVPMTPSDALILIGAGAAGLALARLLRLPAPAIIGPLAVSALVHSIGLTEAQTPGWLTALAQLMIGVGLGLRFGGLGARDVAGAMAVSLLSVVVMLGIAGALAWALTPWSLAGTEALLLSYAPGGIIEMGLIALALGADPVFVTVHHLLRLMLAVTAMPAAFRLIEARARRRGG